MTSKSIFLSLAFLLAAFGLSACSPTSQKQPTPEPVTLEAAKQRLAARAEQVLARLKPALDARDLDEVSKVFAELKALGRPAYPAIYRGYAELTLGEQFEPEVSQNGQTRERDSLGRTLVSDYLSGDLFYAIIFDESGALPEGLMRSAITKLASDAEVSKDKRAARLRTIIKNYTDAHSVVYKALQGLASLSKQWAMDEARTLLASPSTSSASIAATVDFLIMRQEEPHRLQADTLSRLQELLKSANPRIVQSARFALQSIDPGATGYLIRAVDPLSPAAELGLKRGDILVTFGEQVLNSAVVLHGLTDGLEKGQKAPASFYRDGEMHDIRLGVDAYDRLGIWGTLVWTR